MRIAVSRREVRHSPSSIPAQWKVRHSATSQAPSSQPDSVVVIEESETLSLFLSLTTRNSYFSLCPAPCVFCCKENIARLFYKLQLNCLAIVAIKSSSLQYSVAMCKELLHRQRFILKSNPENCL